MSVDPYHEVQREIQGSLQSAANLRASYRRIRSTAREDSEELDYARNELKATLSTLEADLDDLEESVRIVEQSGGRLFGIDDAEVVGRRRYVLQVRREVESMRAEVASSAEARTSRYGDPLAPHAHAGAARRGGDGGRDEEDDQAEWSREEQQMIMQQQDSTLNTISGTLTTIAEQAGLIGQEVGEHIEMLSDLERNVEQTDTKLDGAMKRMQRFIRETEDTKSGWCITILIVILVVLLLAVILV